MLCKISFDQLTGVIQCLSGLLPTEELPVRIQNNRHLLPRNSPGRAGRGHPFGGICAGLSRIYPGIEPGADRHVRGRGHRAAGRHPLSGQRDFLPGSAGKGAAVLARPGPGLHFPVRASPPQAPGRRLCAQPIYHQPPGQTGGCLLSHLPNSCFIRCSSFRRAAPSAPSRWEAATTSVSTKAAAAVME